MERLQKVIASSGYTSRRKAEELIKEGKVYVNGNLVTELGTKVSDKDNIIVEGKVLDNKPKMVYYLINKPRNVICSLKDEKDRKIITDYIDSDERIYPVGRLDYDTTGALILTNDGDFANMLMHPSNNIEKEYLAIVEGIITVDEIYKLKEGITIEGTKVIPKRVKVKKKDKDKNKTKIEITIIEGKNHIVKKIFQKIGHPVIKLTREKIAFLDVKNLKSGEYRYLTKEEISKLKQLKK